MKKLLLGVAGAAALGLLSPAYAVPVATIDGAYDDVAFDTPDLVIHNTSAFAITNLNMHLHAYQGLNNGDTVDTSLPDIPAGTDFTYVWSGATIPHNLLAYDYDDEWGNFPPGYTNPDCVVTTSLCALVGNFDVTITGMWNGNPVFSVFSPTTNHTGGFVGWEGLDPTGLSETIYDVHNGTVGGTLALIDIGVPPQVPEPGVLALLAAGLAGLAASRRRGRKH